MRFLYDVYQHLTPHDSGINLDAGRIVAEKAIIPRRSNRVTLPAGPLTLAEVYAHPACLPLKDGAVPIGLTKNGELIQSTWQGMTTAVVAGNRNFGKSNILKNFGLHALHARQQGFNCQIVLGDPHAGLPDSLEEFFRPILPQFDQTFLGIEIVEEGGYMPFFHGLKREIAQMQQQGFDETTPWKIILIDEADLFFKHKAYGKQAYDIIEYLINLRKARIFFLLSFADTTKKGSGSHGTGIVTAGSTVLCVRYTQARAKIILPERGDAQKTYSLPLGYAAVKIPARQSGEESKLRICKIPKVTAEDLEHLRFEI